MKRLLILPILLLCCLAAAEAHQPYTVKTRDFTSVAEPEISKAFYGELAGSPHTYIVNSSQPFLLYVNILMPYSEPQTYSVSFEILKDGQVIFAADGENATWTKFYEEYGRDNYYMGPEFEQNVSAGTYTVKVFNDNNTGKYSLAIGNIEKFTTFDFIRAFFVATSLDFWFFKQ